MSPVSFFRLRKRDPRNTSNQKKPLSAQLMKFQGRLKKQTNKQTQKQQTERERERGRERERERDRQTDRQTNRQTDRDREEERERNRDRQRERKSIYSMSPVSFFRLRKRDPEIHPIRKSPLARN